MSKHCVACVLTCTAIAGASQAQSVAPSLLAPWPDESTLSLNGGVTLYNDADIDNTSDDLGMSRYQARGRWRPEVTAPNDTHWIVAGRALHLELNHDDALLPERLSDAHVGFGMMTPINDSDWSVGFTAGLGYAGTQPFSDGDAVYLTGDLIFTHWLEPGRSYSVMVNFDGNRGVFPDVPLPGFVYTDARDPNFTWSAGFPFVSARWRLDEKWSLDATWYFPFGAEAEVTYQALDSLAFFAGVESNNDAFWVEDADNTRVFYSEDVVQLGARWDITPTAQLEFTAGYAFGREFETGWDRRDTETLRDVEDAPFVRLSARWRW